MDYKKILEGIVDIINTTEKSDIGFANICTYIGEKCPELQDQESEDEKIRKWLIDWAKAVNWSEQFTITKEQVLAWLEKQRNYDRLIEEMKKRKELLSKEKEKATSTNDKLSIGGRIAMLQELLAFNICNKKELKKIEVVSKEGEDEQSKNWILEYLHDGLRKTDEQFKDQFKTAIAWIEKQAEQKQTWKPSAAQLIVIKDLIEDKNTSNVYKVILRGMFDEFKQYFGLC